MKTVDEIISAINRLSQEDRGKLMAWLHSWDDDDWDRQMRADAQAGKFDKLIARVDADVKAGRVYDLP